MQLSPELAKTVLDTAARLAAQAMTYAAHIPGTLTGAQRENAALSYLKDRAALEVEARDHLLPVVGRYLDLPVVDYAQRRAEEIILRAFIRRIYARAELEKLSAARATTAQAL